MKFLPAIGIVISFLLISAEARCDVEPPFRICGSSTIIERVTREQNEEGSTLRIRARDEIASNAFKDLDIEKLSIWADYFRSRPAYKVSVQPDSFSGLNNLTQLTLLGVKLIGASNALTSLTHLEELNIYFSGSGKVPSELLSTVGRLKKLRIQDYTIDVVPANAFADLNYLTDLDLSQNNISTLQPGCFNGLDDLVNLDLSWNQFTLIPGIFNPLSKLEYLTLNVDRANTERKKYHADAFRGLSSLKSLSMARCAIDLIPGMFNESVNLKEISMTHVTLQRVPKNVFNKLMSLSEIHLDYSDIESIEPGAFSGLNLSILNLHKGFKGKVIHTGCFNDLNVTTLDLSFNSIEEIRSEAFVGLNVEYLDLDKNSIMHIASKAFAGAAIGTLAFAHNPIEELEQNVFKDAKIKSILSNEKVYHIMHANRSKVGLDDSVQLAYSGYLY